MQGNDLSDSIFSAEGLKSPLVISGGGMKREKVAGWGRKREGGREGRKISQITWPSRCLRMLVSCLITLDRGSAGPVHGGGSAPLMFSTYQWPSHNSISILWLVVWSHMLLGDASQKSKVSSTAQKQDGGDFQYTCCSLCLGKWSTNPLFPVSTAETWSLHLRAERGEGTMTTEAEGREKSGQNEGKGEKKIGGKGHCTGASTRWNNRRKEGALSLVADMSHRHHLLTGAGLQAGFSRSQISVCVCVCV